MPCPPGVDAELRTPSISPNTAAIVLAAGRSTRMKSRLPKPLHPICGLPMTGHVIQACRRAGISRIVVVVGHEADAVRQGLGGDVEFALQESPRGTANAVSAAAQLLADWAGSILVIAGDVPLMPWETLQTLLHHHESSNASASMLTATLDDPTGYGRVLRDADGQVARIVEERDASAEERAVKEWNPSIYVFRSAALWSSLAAVQPANAQGEYYLTDTIGILRARGERIEAVPALDSRDCLGVNTRVELAEAAAILRRRILDHHMLSGVTITDPATTYIDADVEIGMDTVVEPNTFLCRGTRVGEDCVLGPFSRIEASRLGSRVRVLASQAVQSELADGVHVGPYANLRAGTILGSDVRIGDFVEVKNSTFGPGAKASHLTYIGDADVGAGTNIGAGTITCNYDGFRKHRTLIGSNAFIGSHSTLVAPVAVGDGAFIAAGSTIAESVPADAMAIARSRATIKDGWAARYRANRTKTPSGEAG